MSEIQLLISESYLKEVTAMNAEVDAKILRPYILTAQQRYLEPLLGTDLFTALLGTTTGNYTTLLNNYVQPCLAHYSYLEAIPYIWVRIGNGGVFKNAPTNTESTAITEIKFIEDRAREKAEHFAQRLMTYLVANYDNFPELATNDACNKLTPTNSAPYAGISLEDVPRPNYNRRLWY
jgi:hypothetical protein